MNIYVAMTPYHILLSLLHANRKIGDMIIVIDQKGSLSHHYECFKNSNFFDVTWRFIDEYKLSKIKKALAFGRLNLSVLVPQIASILTESKEKHIDDIYVFNDNPVSVQYMLSRLSYGAVVHIEDGSAPYNSLHIPASSLQKIIKSVIFGRFYDWKSVLGTSKYIQLGMFSSKNLIRAENKIYPSSDYLISRNSKTIMEKLSETLTIILDGTLADKSALILLPCFSDTNSNASLNKEFVDLISQLKDKEWEVYIKLHPLDWMNEEINEFDNCKVITQHAPAEIIPSLLPSLSLVIGMRTTSLASIKFLYKERDIDIYSISESTKNNNDTLYEYFSAVGVKVYCGCSEVMSEI